MKPILDPACSARAFYFDKSDARVLFGDIRKQPPILLSNGQTFCINPDWQMDFRDLPFDDNSFYLVVFDPPHLSNCGEKSHMKLKYGMLDKTWRDDLARGFLECFRVLKPFGILTFKWNETQIPLKDILALTPEKPIFGHRSGKASKTHWVQFMKGGG